MEAKVNKFDENSKNKIFWKCVKVLMNSRMTQPRAYAIKKVDDTMVAEATSILSR